MVFEFPAGNGITICCDSSCGTCGGIGCDSRSGGAKSCCSSNILSSGISCCESSPPCIVTSCSDQYCQYGIRTHAVNHTIVCCSESCATCGGTGCDLRLGGGKKCCSSSILTSGISCTNSLPPCIVTNGLNTMSQGIYPMDVKTDSINKFLFALLYSEVVKMDLSGNVIATCGKFAGSNAIQDGSCTGDNGATFSYPSAISIIDSRNGIWIADICSIRYINPEMNSVITVYGHRACGTTYTGPISDSTYFEHLVSFDMTADYIHIYIADVYGKIWHIQRGSNPEEINLFVSTGRRIGQIYLDSDQTIYFTEVSFFSASVHMITPSGHVSTIISRENLQHITHIELPSPLGVVLYKDRILITDQQAACVYSFQFDKNIKSIVPGSGKLVAGQCGQYTSGSPRNWYNENPFTVRFSTLGKISIDKSDNICFTDLYTKEILCLYLF